jgi:hypothetical protein
VTLSKDTEIVIGFDHAVSGRDESVAWIGAMVKTTPLNVLVEHEVRVWLNTLVHNQVVELKGTYPNARYCIDATAEGGKEALGECRRANLDTLGVDFSRAKQGLMIGLKNTMQQKLIVIFDEKTLVQLKHYKFSESKTTKGRYKYGAPGTPDDRVDAVALASYRAFLLRTYGGAESAALFVGGTTRLQESAGITFL